MNTEFRIQDTLIRLMQGDILSLKVDAVVNPANTRLSHGGGLAGQIVKRGGAVIQRESDRLGPIGTGGAVITTAGSLPAKFVIHTAGPVQGEGGEDGKILRSFTSVLALATEKKLVSIAIPAVSTGIFGYPATKCAKAMKKALRDFLEKKKTTLREVVVCLYEEEKYGIFLKEFNS
jgi:O-acetyl-ADP-ribose deacetylase (regulator of RNase III)